MCNDFVGEVRYVAVCLAADQSAGALEGLDAVRSNASVGYISAGAATVVAAATAAVVATAATTVVAAATAAYIATAATTVVATAATAVVAAAAYTATAAATLAATSTKSAAASVAGIHAGVARAAAAATACCTVYQELFIQRIQVRTFIVIVTHNKHLKSFFGFPHYQHMRLGEGVCIMWLIFRKKRKENACTCPQMRQMQAMC